MRHSLSEGTLTVHLDGRIDSNNAADVEDKLITLVGSTPMSRVRR